MAGGNVGNGSQAKLRGDILSFVVKTATAIFRGCPVAIDATGYLVMAADSAAMKFVGMSEEGCTAEQATAGAKIRVRRHGIFRMTKNGDTAATDVGKIAYAHTAQTSSVDALVDLAAACTYDNAVGLIVRREPDTPGGATYTKKYLMVDITPAPWSAADIVAHAALADQTAHVDAGIAPSLTAETATNPTTTAAEFNGRLITCAYAGATTIVLPTTGVLAGTQCRIVKAHATAGPLLISAGTLVGPQCASNAFIGCPHLGDSVVIQCVGANSYRIVSLNQQSIVTDYSGDNPTITASAFIGGLVTLSNNGATSTATTLPASGVPVGLCCKIIKVGSAGDVKVTATTLVGKGTSENVMAGQDAVTDTIEVQCVGDDSYRVIGQQIT